MWPEQKDLGLGNRWSRLLNTLSGHLGSVKHIDSAEKHENLLTKGFRVREEKATKLGLRYVSDQQISFIHNKGANEGKLIVAILYSKEYFKKLGFGLQLLRHLVAFLFPGLVLHGTFSI
eukprot:sb/3476325/